MTEVEYILLYIKQKDWFDSKQIDEYPYKQLSAKALLFFTNVKPGTPCSIHLSSKHTFQIFGAHNTLLILLVLSVDQRSRTEE